MLHTSSFGPQLAFLFRPGCEGTIRRTVPFWEKKRPFRQEQKIFPEHWSLKSNRYRGDRGQRLVVFASFKGVCFPHGRKYGCRNGFDHTGNGGHRRCGGYLAHQGGWLSFPLLQHTWTSVLILTRTDDLSKRTPLVRSCAAVHGCACLISPVTCSLF